MTFKIAEGDIVDDKEKLWPLRDVLGLAFTTKIGRPSSAVVVVRATKSVWRNNLRILGHLLAFGLLGLVGLYLCEFSVIIVGLISLYVFVHILPRYSVAFDELSSVNVKTFTFNDPIEIVKVQQDLWEIPLGKHLIKRGLAFGETGERVLSIVLPSSLFDSKRLRRTSKFVLDVLYPIIVVIMPLFVSMLGLASPAWKHLRFLAKKDFLLKYAIEVYKLFGVYLLVINPYTWILTGLSKFISLDADLFTLLEIALSWLRTEGAMLIMKLDFIYTKKLSLVHSLTKLQHYIGKLSVVKFASKVYSALEKPINHAKERINPELIEQVYKPVSKLTSKAAKVQKEYELLREEAKKHD